MDGCTAGGTFQGLDAGGTSRMDAAGQLSISSIPPAPRLCRNTIRTPACHPHSSVIDTCLTARGASRRSPRVNDPSILTAVFELRLPERARARQAPCSRDPAAAMPDRTSAQGVWTAIDVKLPDCLTTGKATREVSWFALREHIRSRPSQG